MQNNRLRNFVWKIIELRKKKKIRNQLNLYFDFFSNIAIVTSIVYRIREFNISILATVIDIIHLYSPYSTHISDSATTFFFVLFIFYNTLWSTNFTELSIFVTHIFQDFEPLVYLIYKLGNKVAVIIKS